MLPPYRRNLFCLAAIAYLATPKVVAAVLDADNVQATTMSPVSSNSIFLATSTLFQGKSLNLSGAQGLLSSASSITASAFFGDGSHLTGIDNPILAATSTFSGANTFLSSVTINSQGRDIALSTGTATNNFILTGGGAARFYPVLHTSSSTIIPSASTTNTLLGTCAAGSTITITTTGGDVEAVFSGTILTSAKANLAVLQDGQFIGGCSGTKGMFYAIGFGGFEYANYGTFTHLITAPAPGSHSYCLTLSSPNGGGAQILEGGSPALFRNKTNIFYVVEQK